MIRTTLLTRLTENNFGFRGFLCIRLKLVVLEFELQGKSKGGEGNCEPQEKSQKRTELASGGCRTEPLGATVNVQDPPKPPHCSGRSTCGLPAHLLWSSSEKEGQVLELCSELPSGSHSLPQATCAVQQLSSPLLPPSLMV